MGTLLVGATLETFLDQVDDAVDRMPVRHRAWGFA